MAVSLAALALAEVSMVAPASSVTRPLQEDQTSSTLLNQRTQPALYPEKITINNIHE